ncbi:MAG: VCBS repeat-containing protein [Myxococcales bacterium]|nr:VCBS repeat-containing protein [Myxococcales bacterium]
MKRLARGLPAALLLLVAGCSGRGVIALRVEAGAAVAGVDHLVVRVEHAGQRAIAEFPLVGRPVAIPPAQTLNLVFGADRRGAVAITVEARAADGRLLATGNTGGEIAPGESRSFQVDLSPAAPVDGAIDQPLDGAAPDLPSTDLAATDLAAADLAGVDLATSDLATPDLPVVDLGVPDQGPPDLASNDLGLSDGAQLDLAKPDLATADLPVIATPDLAKPPDLAKSDLGMAPDCAPNTTLLGMPGYPTPHAGVLPMAVAIGHLNKDQRGDLVVMNSMDGTLSVFLTPSQGAPTMPLTLAIGKNPTDLKIADVSNDGIPDLIVANTAAPAAVGVLTGKGDGTFNPLMTFPVGNEGVFAIAVGDLDGDTKPDIAAATSQQNVYILLNQGQGLGFKAPVKNALAMSATTIAIGDVTGDGKPDLALGMSNGMLVNVLVNQGGGTFKPGDGTGLAFAVAGLALADLDQDAKADLIVVGGSKGSTHISKGDGTFQAGVGFSPGQACQGLVVADLDGDGAPDIASTDQQNDLVTVSINSGNGGLKLPFVVFAGHGPTGMAVGDVNGDGRLDLATANSLGDNASVLLSEGKGAFRGPVRQTVPANPTSIASGDINKDGKLDLVTLHEDGTLARRLGNGGGAFSPQQTLKLGAQARGLVIADLNSDGTPDLLATSGAGSGALTAVLSKMDGSGLNAPVTTVVLPGTEGVALGLLNGDLKLDAVVYSGSAGKFGIFLGKGDGTFNSSANYSPPGGVPVAAAFANYNGDAFVDFAVAVTAANNDQILLHTGNGTDLFGGVVPVNLPFPPSGMSFGPDVNGDGKPDLIVLLGGAGVMRLYLNQGVGYGPFTDFSLGPGLTSARVDDFNLDGKPDIVTYGLDGILALFLGAGNGTLLPPAPYFSGHNAGNNGQLQLTLGDWNGDGKIDVAALNFNNGNVNPSCSVMLNRGPLCVF